MRRREQRDVIDGARLLIDALDEARAACARTPECHACVLEHPVVLPFVEKLQRLGYDVVAPPPPPHEQRYAEAVHRVRHALKEGDPWKVVEYYAPRELALAEVSPTDLAYCMIKGGLNEDKPTAGRDEAIREVHRFVSQWVSTWKRPKRPGRGGGKTPQGKGFAPELLWIPLGRFVGAEKARDAAQVLASPKAWLPEGPGKHGWPVRLTTLVVGDLFCLGDDAIARIVKNGCLVP
jgi:hypothetical protein